MKSVSLPGGINSNTTKRSRGDLLGLPGTGSIYYEYIKRRCSVKGLSQKSLLLNKLDTK